MWETEKGTEVILKICQSCCLGVDNDVQPTKYNDKGCKSELDILLLY